MTRLGDWQETYNGIKFWSLDPRPEEVDIYDIAHALANICRYNGHCHKFYSVAQHSVFAAMEANDAGYDIEVVLAALMHDASEAYICDIPRPIKPYLTNYKEIEEHLMACIWEKLGLKVSYEDPRIKAIDNNLVCSEAVYLLPSKGAEWSIPHDKHIEIQAFFTPEESEEEFLKFFRGLMTRRCRNSK